MDPSSDQTFQGKVKSGVQNMILSKADIFIFICLCKYGPDFKSDVWMCAL